MRYHILMDTQTYIGKKLREARIACNMSVAEAAAKIGKSRSALYTWEAGEYDPGGPNMLKLCHIYNVGFDFFFPDEDEESERQVALNDEELDIIGAYRTSSPEGKKAIAATAKAMSGEHAG